MDNTYVLQAFNKMLNTWETIFITDDFKEMSVEVMDHTKRLSYPDMRIVNWKTKEIFEEIPGFGRGVL
jgi:hypothetical protein